MANDGERLTLVHFEVKTDHRADRMIATLTVRCGFDPDPSNRTGGPEREQCVATCQKVAVAAHKHQSQDPMLSTVSWPH